MSRWRALAFVSCLLALSSRVEAQQPTELLAESLFEEGKALLEAGDVSEACAKLEESQRLDAGGGTVLLLGICRMREGKTATAWTTLKTALSMARRAEREDRVSLATRAMEELSPRLSYVSLTVPEAAIKAGTSLELDGVPLNRAAWNTTFMMDPGEHTLLVSSPNLTPHSSVVRIREGERIRVDVPLPTPRDTAPASPFVPVQVPRAAKRVPAPGAVVDMGGSEAEEAWLRAGPWLVGALGAAAIGAGVVLEIRAHDRHAEAGRQTVASDALESSDAAQGLERAAVVTLASGALLVGAGITWEILRHSEGNSTAGSTGTQLHLGFGCLELRSDF